MARRKPIKKYTLNEFKAWLEGIEEIQPDDWCPDLPQWRMIREKISAIVIPPPAPVINQGGHPLPGPGPSLVRQAQPMSHQRPAAIPAKSSLDDGKTPDMTPAAQAALSGKLPAELATDPSKGSKTPNIDTMDGNYESTFT